MNQKETHQKILSQVEHYYTEKLKVHGANHKGVDWNSRKSQHLRFDQLLRLTQGDYEGSLIDYGCGYGAMAPYIRTLGYKGRYTGYDVSGEMIKEAQKKNARLTNCIFVTDELAIKKSDYTLASGIFDVKQKITDKKWKDYILHTLDRMAVLSRKGFAFNILTKYVDFKRPDLYYADPCFFIDHCIRNYSRHIALFQDYGLYEFTLVIRFAHSRGLF